LKFKQHQEETHKNNSIKKIKVIDRKNRIQKVFYSLVLLLFYELLSKYITLNRLNDLIYEKKRIDVVCLENSHNVGNILVKYSMFKKYKN